MAFIGVRFARESTCPIAAPTTWTRSSGICSLISIPLAVTLGESAACADRCTCCSRAAGDNADASLTVSVADRDAHTRWLRPFDHFGISPATSSSICSTSMRSRLRHCVCRRRPAASSHSPRGRARQTRRRHLPAWHPATDRRASADAQGLRRIWCRLHSGRWRTHTTGRNRLPR